MTHQAGASVAIGTALPVALALVHERDRAALVRAADGVTRLVLCHTVDEADALIRREPPAVFVTRRRDADGARVEPLVHALRLNAPNLPVVLLALAEDSRRRNAGDLVAAGVTCVARATARDVRAALRTVLARERARALRAALAAECAALAPDSARDMVRVAFENGDRPLAVLQLAASLGVPRKTLDRRLLRRSPLTPRRALVWGRLAAIAIALEDHETTVAAVASSLQFTSPTALRNMLQRYTGLTPTELRAAGGLDAISTRIQAILTTGPRH